MSNQIWNRTVLERTNGGPRPGPQDSDVYNTFGQLSIADIFEFVRQYFFLIAATTSVCILVALVHVFTATPLFTAYGQLLIDVKVPHLANEQWREAGMVLDGAQVESQIAVLRSEPVARAVVQRLDLVDDPLFNPLKSSSGGETSTKAASSSDADAKPSATDPDEFRAVIRSVQGGLGISRVGFAYVLEVSFTSPSPESAARVANAFMQAYIDDQIAVRSEAARQGSEWLESRINTLRVQMNRASLKVQEFKARRDYSIIGRTPSQGDDADAKAAKAKGVTETLDELESTAMTYRRMFESALQAYTEAEQRQSYPGSYARVISSATPPLRKSSPKRVQILAIATIAGLIFGLGLGLLREALRFVNARRHPLRSASQT